MRILVFMTHLCPWSRPTAASLQALGHEVHVFDFEEGEQDGFTNARTPGILEDFKEFERGIAGVHLVPTKLRGKSKYLFVLPRVRRLIRLIQPDILLTLYGGGFALMAYLSGFRPYAVYAVGSDILLAKRTMRLVNRRVLTAASQVFANGQHLAGRAKENAPAARILPLLIGVDLEPLRPADFTARPAQLICTRAFSSVYNNDAIIHALARFPPNVPDFRMVFVSTGLLLQQSIALADRLLSPTFRARVEFWRGAPRHMVLEGLRRSHLFVSMARSDGTSTSLLEAMACGLFPIISDIPQNREWVASGDSNGILVELDNPDKLATALLKAIKNLPACGQQASVNRRMIEQRADARHNRRILAQSLEAIVKRHAKR